MKGVILERLEKECSSYVSNLRFDRNPEVLKHLLKMDIEQYSLEEWGYSLSYIFDKDLRFNSFKEVCDFINNKP